MGIGGRARGDRGDIKCPLSRWNISWYRHSPGHPRHREVIHHLQDIDVSCSCLRCVCFALFERAGSRKDHAEINHARLLVRHRCMGVSGRKGSKQIAMVDAGSARLFEEAKTTIAVVSTVQQGLMLPLKTIQSFRGKQHHQHH